MSQYFARSQPTPRRTHRSALRMWFRGGTAAVVASASLVLLAPSPATAQSAPLLGTASAAAATAAGTVVATAGTVQPTASRYWATMTTGKYERRLKLWINRARARNGIRSVNVTECEDRFAEQWAGFLKGSNSFYHQDLGPLMKTCRQTYAGEILALGSVTPWRMVRMWLASPDHRRLMLTRGFNRAGISAVRDGNNVWVGCIDFGRR